PGEDLAAGGDPPAVEELGEGAGGARPRRLGELAVVEGGAEEGGELGGVERRRVERAPAEQADERRADVVVELGRRLGGARVLVARALGDRDQVDAERLDEGDPRGQL